MMGPRKAESQTAEEKSQKKQGIGTIGQNSSPKNKLGRKMWPIFQKVEMYH
jgi:hypothetical protein